MSARETYCTYVADIMKLYNTVEILIYLHVHVHVHCAFNSCTRTALLLPPGSSSSKHSTVIPVRLSDQDLVEVGVESGGVSGDGVEEVLVEVVEEGALTKGAFVDEFRQEQQLEKSKAKLSKGTCTAKIRVKLTHNL